MASSLLQVNRFRVAFGVWWMGWAALHFFVLHNAAFPWQAALCDSVVSTVLLALAVVLVTVSLHYYLPSPTNYSYLLVLSAAITVIWLSISRAVLLLLLKEGTEYSSFFSQSLLIRGAAGFLMVGCATLLGMLWYTLQDHREMEKRSHETERLAKDAELNSLRQQLQPHFLFNSLNSISALVGAQPQKARTMIQQLSDFLRGTLKKDQAAWVSLEEELAHLQLYLDIEKVRFGHRLTTIIESDATAASLPVMLLQPVVENAIKFGLYDTVGDVTITIRARLQDGNLVVEVANPFDKDTAAPKAGTGFGLSSVQRRLYLLFARNDLLQTGAVNNIFTTTIKIPQA